MIRLFKNSTLTIAAILVFGLTIRLVFLGSNPNGFYCDEAINGYDAYCIAKTGKDMSGNRMPLLMNHFGLDNPESLYTYCCVPLMAIMGLNPAAVRATSALLGTLSLLLVFFFVRDLIDKRTALFTMLFLTVSPLHLHFSRIGLRHITATVVMIAGMWLLHISAKKPTVVPFAGLVLGLGANTYPSVKISLPLILVAYVIIYRNRFRKLYMDHRKKLIIGIALFFIGYIVFCSASIIISGQTQNYMNKSVLHSPHPGLDIIENLSKHLGFSFFIGPGDLNPRNNVPGNGVTLSALFPFFLLAIVSGIIQRRKEVILMTIWLFAGVLPGSVTWESVPHFGRAISTLPSVEILSAIGLCLWFDFLMKFRKPTLRRLIIIITIIFITVNAGIYLDSELIKYPQNIKKTWQFGLESAINSARELKLPDQQIYLDKDVNQAFIFALFFGKRDPVIWHSTRNLGDVAVCLSKIKYCFYDNENSLFIVKPNDIPHAEIIDIITDSEGYVEWKIVSNLDNQTTGGFY